MKKKIMLLSILITLQLYGCEKGCTDVYSCNYSSTADIDDGSCDYSIGCKDASALNYDPSACKTDNTLCIYCNENDVKTDDTHRIKFNVFDINRGSPFENQVISQFEVYSIIDETCQNGNWNREGKIYLDISNTVDRKISYDFVLKRTGQNGIAVDYQEIVRNLVPGQKTTFLLDGNRVLHVEKLSWQVFLNNINYH